MAYSRLRFGALPLLMLFVLPLLAALFFMLADVTRRAGWHGLWQHPQLWGGLALSLGTAAAATLIAFFLGVLIGASVFERGLLARLSRSVAAMLAVPHLAFAIGLSFLVMPSGLLARLLAPLMGWASPPGWITTHDPYGFALTIALACKETGFVLFNVLAALSRPETALAFRQQKAAAQSLGHGSLSIWLRLFVPQLWPSLRWPVAITFVYAATVVDMALVLGPTQPPTLALVAWSDLNSANVGDNARGTAAATLLALAAALVLALARLALHLMRQKLHSWITRGPSQRALPSWLGLAKWRGLEVIFVAVVLCLIILSFAPLWPFPEVLPSQWNGAAWGEAFDHASPLWLSLAMALATSLSALVLLLLWFEGVDELHDKLMLALSMVALALPALLLALGQYKLLLRLDLTGTVAGLYMVHLMPVVAYMFIVLRGPYRDYDARFASAAAALGRGRCQHLSRIKWPLLKAPLASSLAVGFAVSFGQYVPAQLAAAGRLTTLPMEAVTLSSGANRPLTAAFALLLMLPPLVTFLAAGLPGRNRWRAA
jgi:putative thiamine transport system permease protein